MATIAKISNGASASSAIGYARGANRDLKNNTEQWLADQGLTLTTHSRAVVESGTGGIEPDIASRQFSAINKAFNHVARRNQVLRITQSFAVDELDARNPADWQTANDLGRELAERLYPNNQALVATHIDGENHVVHNHIIVNKVDFTTGKKLAEFKGQTVERARAVNDQIAQEQGWHVLEPARDHFSKTEKDLTAKNDYSYMADLRGRINSTMQNDAVSDFQTFSAVLEKKGVDVLYRGKNVSYAFLDANNKSRYVRGKRLGTDYDKGAIDNELERRTKQLGQVNGRANHAVDVSGSIKRESGTTIANATSTISFGQRIKQDVASTVSRITTTVSRIRERMSTGLNALASALNSFNAHNRERDAREAREAQAREEAWQQYYRSQRDRGGLER